MKIIERLWPKFYFKLPPTLVYYCAMRVWSESTSGPYGNTIVPEITAGESVQRFARKHGIPGHGRDEFFDSNRLVK